MTSLLALLSSAAGYVAPAATMIAAMMTAASLGARITGYGFIVFTLGSLSWALVGLASGQTNLVATNIFLTLVNLVGIWRWLGRQLRYEQGGKSAERASRRSSTPTLFTATGLSGMAVVDRDRVEVGTSVEALVECSTGSVSYVVIATGGVGGVAERLYAIPREAIEFGCTELRLLWAHDAIRDLRPLVEGDWPASASGLRAA